MTLLEDVFAWDRKGQVYNRGAITSKIMTQDESAQKIPPVALCHSMFANYLYKPVST